MLPRRCHLVGHLVNESCLAQAADRAQHIQAGIYPTRHFVQVVKAGLAVRALLKAFNLPSESTRYVIGHGVGLAGCLVLRVCYGLIKRCPISLQGLVGVFVIAAYICGHIVDVKGL